MIKRLMLSMSASAGGKVGRSLQTSSKAQFSHSSVGRPRNRTQRDEPGDRERGLEVLDQALAIFEQCAAKKDVESVVARREVLI